MIISDTINLPEIDKDGYYKAYKVIENKNISLYNNFTYKIGWNQSSRKTKELTFDETYLVEKGFHLFLNKCDAINECGRLANECGRLAKVIEVYFKRENVVATGFWNIQYIKNVVVTKLLIRSLQDVSEDMKG